MERIKDGKKRQKRASKPNRCEKQASKGKGGKEELPL
jgi:hypothetical protein